MQPFITPLRIATLCALVILFGGCLKDECRRTYTIYTPVKKTLAQARADMRMTAPREMENTGKIAVFGNTIYLNEKGAGIHVIDNSNPASPKPTGFIPVPGNVDVAVRGAYLYADSYSDVVVMDISSPGAARTVKFMDNLIPEKNQYWPVNRPGNPDSIMVTVDYVKKDTTVECQASTRFSSCPNCMTVQSGLAAAPVQTSTGGSMASFTVINSYLYAVSQSSLYSIDISNGAAPVLASRKALGWGIETIYPFKDKLFIGSQNGMFIYDVSNGGAPVHQGSFAHATFCDPVVTDGEYAYVTLRGGGMCRGVTNELNVVDVRNLSAPTIVKRYNLENPYGLAKQGNLLMICDGKAGLKTYDASQPTNLKPLQDIPLSQAYDVIAFPDRALVVAKDGLYQFRITDNNRLLPLSKISTSKN